VEEATDLFRERYALRSGIESTNSGLKNRLGLGRLSVRGMGSVSRMLRHKLAGWNVLRASASRTLKAWVASRVAETLGASDPGRFERRFGHLERLGSRAVRVCWRVVRPEERSALMPTA